MKKSIKSITLALLSVGMLAGCTPASSTTGGWSKEEKALMQEHLYGEVLPYVSGIEDFQLAYEASMDLLVGLGAETTVEQVQKYASSYKEKAGWENVTPSSAPEYYYSFEKVVSTAKGKRHVKVLFATIDEEGNIAEGGLFCLQAGDPYLYDFPTEHFQELTIEYFDCDTPVPTFPADYYQLNQKGTAVYCYVDSSTEDAGYTAILREAGWIIEEERDSDGYLVATEPSRAFAVAYLYDRDYGSLDIYLSYAPAVKYDSWPAEQISAIFEEVEEVEFGVPAFEGEGLKFSAELYEFFGFALGVNVVVYGATSDQINKYLEETLPGDNWTVDFDEEEQYGEASKTFEDLNGVANIGVEVSEGLFYITLYFGLDPIPGTYWPAEEISAAFKAAGQPEFEIPSPEGEDLKFTFVDYQEYGYNYGVVKVSGMTQDILDAYLLALGNDKWDATPDSYGDLDYYKHFEEQGFTAHIYVEKYYFENGYDYINIRIYYVGDPDPVAFWPTDDIAALLGEDVTDVLPEFVFEGATFKVCDDEYGKDVICFVGEENQEAAMTAYKGILDGSGFIYDEANNRYASPNGQFYVTVYKGTDGAVGLQITFPFNVSKEVTSFVEGRGVEGFVCPDFSSLDVNESYSYSPKYYYYQLCFNGDCVEDVLAILEDAGYVVPEEPDEDYGYICYSADEQVEMDVDYYDSYDLTVIMIYATADLA